MLGIMLWSLGLLLENVEHGIKMVFLSWLLNDFQIFLIIELNMNLIFLNMYFNESRMDLFFFWRESQKQTKFVVKDDTIYLWRKCFFKYNEKKIYKTFFSSLHTSGQAYMLFLTTPKNVRNLDSICPHI